MITVENLTKRFGKALVLDGIGMEARKGEVTLLTGANGAGKTTTLRILAGALKADSGKASVGGIDIVSNRREAQRNIAFLPQAVTFDPRLNCRQLLRFYSRLRGCDSSKIAELLDQVGLTKEASKKVGELSGGLRQRLGLAILLLPDAPVLLLDEPGLSLDPVWRNRMQEILREKANDGDCVLVATHLLAEWDGVADRCLNFQDGKIVSEIDPKNLYGEGAR